MYHGTDHVTDPNALELRWSSFDDEPSAETAGIWLATDIDDARQFGEHLYCVELDDTADIISYEDAFGTSYWLAGAEGCAVMAYGTVVPA